MKRIFKVIAVLLMVIICTQPAIVLASSEDYTTYTEVDDDGVITVTATKIDANSMDADVTELVYYDFGASYFDSDWSLEYEVTQQSPSAVNSYAYGLAVFQNDVPTTQGLRDFFNDTASADAIYIFTLNTNPNTYYKIGEHKAGSADTESSAISLDRATYTGTKLYFTVNFDDDAGTYGTVYLNIYSDASRTSSLGSVSKALTEENSWRYFSQLKGWDRIGSGGDVFSVDIENLEMTTGEQLALTTGTSLTAVEYDYINDEITFTANVTATAGTPTSIFMAYSFDQVTYYPATAYEVATGVYESSWTVDGDYEGDTVYYYGYGWMGEQYAEGSEEDEPLDRTDLDTPYGYIIDCVDTYTSGGEDVEVWYQLQDDGGSSCNITVYYTNDGWATANSTSTATGKVSGDSGYLTLVDNMTSDTLYYARAVITNDSGSSNTTDVDFIWYDQTTPYGTTLGAEVGGNFGVTTQVTFKGTITDDGGGAVVYGFEWWVTGGTHYYWYSYEDGGIEAQHYTGDNVTYTNALAQGTEYNYRLLLSNEAFRKIDCSGEYNYRYENTMTVDSGDVTGNAVVGTVSLTSIDSTTVQADFYVLNDSGTVCQTWLEYKLDTASQYTSNYANDFDSAKLTGDLSTQYITGLEYGKAYYIRSVIRNLWGSVSYGSPVLYKNWSDESGGDLPSAMCEGFAGTDAGNEVVNWIGSSLPSEVVKELILLGVMIVIAIIFWPYKIVLSVLEVVIFILGLILGFVPDIVMIIIAVLAVIPIVMGVRAVFFGQR